MRKVERFAVRGKGVCTACLIDDGGGSGVAEIVARAFVFRVRISPSALAVKVVRFVYVCRLRPFALEKVELVGGDFRYNCFKRRVRREVYVVVKVQFIFNKHAAEVVVHIAVEVEIRIVRLILYHHFAVVISRQARALDKDVFAVEIIVCVLIGQAVGIAHNAVVLKRNRERRIVVFRCEIVGVYDRLDICKADVNGRVAHRRVAVGYALGAFFIEEVTERAVAVFRRIKLVILRHDAVFEEVTKREIGVARNRFKVGNFAFAYLFDCKGVAVSIHVFKGKRKGKFVCRYRVVDKGKLACKEGPIVCAPTEGVRKDVDVGKVNVYKTVFVACDIFLRRYGRIARRVAKADVGARKGEVLACRRARARFAVEEAIVRNRVVFRIPDKSARACHLVFVRPVFIAKRQIAGSVNHTRGVAVAHRRISAHCADNAAAAHRARYVAKRVGVMHGRNGNRGVVGCHIPDDTACAKHLALKGTDIHVRIGIGDFRGEMIIKIGGVEGLLIPDKSAYVRKIIFVCGEVDIAVYRTALI